MSGNIKKRAFWSIRNKIIFSIYLVMFPVLITAGIFIYIRNSQNVAAENTRRYQSAAEALNDTIGYFEQDLQDILTYVVVNSDVERALRSGPDLGDYDPLFWQKLTPMNFITDMLNVKSNIGAFILYPENGLVPYYTSLDGSVMSKEIADIRNIDIYRRAVSAKGDAVWERVPAGTGGMFEKNSNDKILLAREIFDGSKRIKLGFMALSIDVAQYERICSRFQISPSDGIVLVDGNYNEIARVGNVDETDFAFYSNTSDNIIDAGGSYIFAVPRDSDGWIFYLTSKAAWESQIREGLLQPVILGAALLVSILPISLFASRLISRPAMRLHASMNRFKEGDFSQRALVVGNDEIAELSETFNTMARDLKDLIDRSYVLALREKESELNALQAQINPHFLYNALDSLYWQAAENGQEELSENVLALSELFRLALSSGQSEITVRQEIELISNYLHIQKMRFSKKLDYSIDVDETMMNCRISKLILQPFVENAIVHGLERLDRRGSIRVAGKLASQELRFVIEDNGTGMPQEKLDMILSNESDGRYANQRMGRYAIRNVIERMELRYGGKAKLTIESKVGAGTRVSITVPAEEYPSTED